MTGIERFEDYERKLRQEYGSPGDNIFTISGLSGAGKSTLGSLLAEEFRLKLMTSGKFFREHAKKRGMTIEEFDERAQEIEEEEDVDFDLTWDRKVLESSFKEDGVVFDGRLTGIVLYGIAKVRVLVTCDIDTRARRVAKREGVSEEEAREMVESRDEEIIKRYRKKYNVEIKNHDYYNVIIDNSAPLEEVREKLMEKVDEETGD